MITLDQIKEFALEEDSVEAMLLAAVMYEDQFLDIRTKEDDKLTAEIGAELFYGRAANSLDEWIKENTVDGVLVLDTAEKRTLYIRYLLAINLMSRWVYNNHLR